MRQTSLALSIALLAAAAPAVAAAQANDPALAPVAAFNGVLLNTMKAGKSLGYAGRVQKLTPAVETYFNIPYMSFVAVGPAAWAKMSAGEKASVEGAFARYTVANYAKNFDSYEGQKFAIDSAVLTRGQDKAVKTQIVSPKDSPTNLTYRLRQSGGSWKIIDVMYNNISQLTTQHADFASSVAGGGAPALVAKLDALTAKLKE